MKKIFFLVIFFLTNVYLTTAQATFESGYFINENQEKIDCLIKNERWLFSPNEVFYKTTEGSEIKSFTVKNCKEFQIGDGGVYKRVNAKFPITQSQLKKREKTPEPEMVQLEVFVQTVVKGQASLYWYVDNNGIVYLYSKGDGPIVPLVYKKYVLENLKVKENNKYKKQLIEDFECGNNLIVQKTTYKRKSLISYFKYLNTCSNEPNFVVYKRGTKQKANFLITFKIWAGLEQNRYAARMRNSEEFFEFENVVSPKFGGELEAFFPYFGYKEVSLFLSGQFSKTDNSFVFPDTNAGPVSLNADFSIFELQVGGRFYLNLGSKSSIFAETALALDFFGNSILTETRIVRNFLDEGRMETNEVGSSFDNRVGISFGLGYSYNKRFYIRAAIRANQNVISFSDRLSRLSLSLGYALWE